MRQYDSWQRQIGAVTFAWRQMLWNKRGDSGGRQKIRLMGWVGMGGDHHVLRFTAH